MWSSCILIHFCLSCCGTVSAMCREPTERGNRSLCSASSLLAGVLCSHQEPLVAAARILRPEWRT